MTADNPERYPRFGLQIWRRVDASLASNFATEALEFLKESRQEPLPTDEICILGRLASQLQGHGKVVPQVLDLLGATTDNYGINFIYHPPGVRGDFHPDAYSSLKFFQATAGALDIAPGAASQEEAERNHTRFEFSAGDLVLQQMPYLLHRGVNQGDQPRILVASMPLPPPEQRFGEQRAVYVA